jgi:hypothetical protein
MKDMKGCGSETEKDQVQFFSQEGRTFSFASAGRAKVTRGTHALALVEAHDYQPPLSLGAGCLLSQDLGITHHPAELGKPSRPPNGAAAAGLQIGFRAGTSRRTSRVRVHRAGDDPGAIQLSAWAPAHRAAVLTRVLPWERCLNVAPATKALATGFTNAKAS